MQTLHGTLHRTAPELEHALARYRHDIFIRRLGWKLPVDDGLERDQFDDPDTFYVLSRDAHGAICGCACLLPTTRPYLLSEVFPDLMGGAPLPNGPDVWELSRFSATPADPACDVDPAANTRLLLAAVVESALHLGARRLISVSPLGVERLLHRMGVHAHRAGPPRLVDGKPVFACWIELDATTRTALGVPRAPEPAGVGRPASRLPELHVTTPAVQAASN
ncbi:N-acylhomoserine lactone synthase [Oxalobacteraceae bacterium OM1]|nr:N-acylhomoserine lactone synthase [Oxalobacteraceae bacterium OM1]